MRLLSLISISALSLFQAGCSTTFGTYEPTTHFAYPNSNVQPMGHISASVSEGAFLFPPSLDKEKVLKLMNDALSKKPSADTIINYRFDTTYTVYPFYTVQLIKLEGTAAKMQVGEKELLDKSKYR